MATGTTGAPGNIPYPVGSDQYALTSDLAGMASQTNLALVNAVADAVSTAQWSRGILPAGANLATIQPGAYSVPTFAAAQGISPALPTEALGAGSLVIHPGTTYRSIEFVPIGVTIRPKPIWRNELNTGLNPPWYGWHRVDAGAALPAPLNTDLITVLGDSQSDATVAGNWVGVAEPLITQSFVKWARSGDDTNAVGIRAGFVKPLVTVAGGVIPASGAVTVTTAEQLQLRDNRVLVSGTIAGVVGSLRHDAGGSFTFTRAEAGSAVTVAGPTRFESSFTTAASVIVVWMGGNDITQGSAGTSASIADHIVGNYRAAVEWGAKKGQTVVVAGLTNRRDGGDASFQQVLDVNARLRALYPDRFLNVQGYLSQHALADAGITSTQADRDAMARGMIPPSLFLADGVHLTTAAYQALGAKRIAPWLVASGYAAATGLLPPPAPIVPPAASEPGSTDWTAAIAALNAAAA